MHEAFTYASHVYVAEGQCGLGEHAGQEKTRGKNNSLLQWKHRGMSSSIFGSVYSFPCDIALEHHF